MNFPQWPAEAPFVHVVLFKLPPNAPADARSVMEEEIATKLAPLPTVEAIWWGTPADTAAPDRPMVDARYEVGLMVLFKDKPALDAYLEHPDHVRFAQKWDTLCTLRVFDFTR
jgi:hypothetical protein